MHSQCFANGLNHLFFSQYRLSICCDASDGNFVAITFSRLKKKPVRLPTQHQSKIKSYTIFKSKFPLKMISIAFQANSNHVLETISSVDVLNIGEIQCNALLMSTLVLSA